MARIVALGSGMFVTALTGVGAEPVRCEGAADFEAALRRLALERDVQIVFVAESLADAATEAMEAFRRRSSAAVLALPLTPSAEKHPSLEQVRYLVEQATGARLI